MRALAERALVAARHKHPLFGEDLFIGPRPKELSHRHARWLYSVASQAVAGRWILREKSRRGLDWQQPVAALAGQGATLCSAPIPTSEDAVTTIAWKDGVLAADSFVTDDSTAMQVRKVVRLPHGDVAGGAGPLAEVVQALSWLAKGSKGEPPGIENTCILFTERGKAHYAGCGWPGTPIKGVAAIGSGAQGALVAMKLGLSAAEAVAAVAGVDPCTGGEIEVLAYAKPKRKP